MDFFPCSGGVGGIVVGFDGDINDVSNVVFANIVGAEAVRDAPDIFDACSRGRCDRGPL